MKKQLAVIGILVFLIFSCKSSAGIIFDDSVPVEQTAWLSTASLGTTSIGKIIGYNGIAVDWSGVTKMIQIPAGNTVLEWNIDASDYHTHYTGKNILFAYNYKPQKQYFFAVRVEDEMYGLRVYEFEMGEMFSTSSTFEERFVEFVPFLNVKSNLKTVLD